MKQTCIFVFAFFLFTACNYADMPGMFVVENSINDRFEQSLNYNKNNEVVEINSFLANGLLYSINDLEIVFVFGLKMIFLCNRNRTK